MDTLGFLLAGVVALGALAFVTVVVAGLLIYLTMGYNEDDKE